MSVADSKMTSKIAKHRVHIERLIKKVKTYCIVSDKIPTSLFHTINQIWTVCCYLTLFLLNEEEESLFMTLRTFDSFCSSCSNFVTLNTSILLTVVTAYGLNQLGFDNSMWPLFVTEMHTNPGRLNCANCDTQTTEPVLRNVLNSRFLFI